MDLNAHMKRYVALEGWFKTTQGASVAHALAEELQSIANFLSGEMLLQLGYCGQSPWLKGLKFKRMMISSPDSQQYGIDIAAFFNQLPFDRNSVDCIIAPFMFECFASFKNPLDELDRILKPGGHIVFFGVNPLSFWGLALKLGRLSIFGPVKISALSVLSVKHAVLLRGYQHCALSTFYYIPPVARESLLNGLAFLNEMGKMLWPYPAGFYCLVVQKQAAGLLSLKTDMVKDGYWVCAN